MHLWNACSQLSKSELLLSYDSFRWRFVSYRTAFVGVFYPRTLFVGVLYPIGHFRWRICPRTLYANVLYPIGQLSVGNVLSQDTFRWRFVSYRTAFVGVFYPRTLFVGLKEKSPRIKYVLYPIGQLSLAYFILGHFSLAYYLQDSFPQLAYFILYHLFLAYHVKDSCSNGCFMTQEEKKNWRESIENEGIFSQRKILLYANESVLG